MIVLDRVTMLMEKRTPVLQDVSVRIPTDRRLAVLGTDEIDNAIFLRVIAGMILPSAGRIHRHARTSFPIGYFGGLTVELSARENVAHVAKLYEADADATIRFVQEMSGLGPEFDRPLLELNKFKRALVTLVLDYAIPFDIYLIDRTVGRGNNAHGAVAVALFEARMKSAGAMLTTRNVSVARRFCETAAILHRGRFVLYDDFEQAVGVFGTLAASHRTSVATLEDFDELERLTHSTLPKID